MKKDDNNKNAFPIVYGARNRDSQVLRESTSGGVFTAITDVFLENGDSVCGVVFSDNFEVIHVVTNERKVRDKMRGAKYVQSSLGNVFVEIEQVLSVNKRVLFIGTPCQVAGLKNYILQQKVCDENLFTIDIICHGVPSPKVFLDHIHYIEQKYGKIMDYSFRNKKIGWRGQNVTITTEMGDVPSKIAKSFSNLYFNSVITRPSCHKCQFSTFKRVGDITIGDFWGVSEENGIFDDNRGISEILINSEKGLSLFELCKKDLEYFKVRTKSYIQPNMISPTEKSFVAESFWLGYSHRGFAGYKVFLRKLKFRMFINKICRKLNGMINLIK